MVIASARTPPALLGVTLQLLGVTLLGVTLQLLRVDVVEVLSRLEGMVVEHDLLNSADGGRQGRSSGSVRVVPGRRSRFAAGRASLY